MLRSYQNALAIQNGYKIITQPSENVLDLSEMKAYLRLNSDAEDSLISSLVKSASNKLEQYSNLSFSYKEIQVTYHSVDFGAIVNLPYGKHRELVSVESYKDGIASELDESEYKLDDSGDFYRLQFLRATEEMESFRVTFLAGFADENFSGGGSANIPDEILTAIKVTVADWYTNRNIDSDSERVQYYSIPSKAKTMINSLSRQTWF